MLYLKHLFITFLFLFLVGCLPKAKVHVSKGNASDPPSIISLDEYTTNEDTPITISDVTIHYNAALSCSSNLNLVSSNLDLLSQNGITIGGTYPNCTFELSPVSNASGSTTLTMSVTDSSGLVVSDTFTLNVTPVNDAPMIANVPNLNINEDTSLIPVNITITDDGNISCSSSVNIISSNEALVKSNSISLTGQIPTCSLSLTPEQNMNGTSTITLTVTDQEGLSSQISFGLNVDSINDPPTIINLDQYTTNEDIPITISNVTIFDDGPLTCGNNLSLVSSNLDLLSQGGITIGGTYPNCNLELSPVSNASGSTTVTMTVTDSSGMTVSDTFILNVNPVNDAPTISNIQNQTTNEDTSLSGISFTINDVDGTLNCSNSVSVSSINTNLITLAGLSRSGTAPNCFLSATPLSDAYGTSTITLTVTDSSGANSSSNFVLTVNPVNDAPTIANIPDQIINEDNSLVPMNIAIKDDGNISCSSSVSVTSSNETLVKATSISLTGQAPNCSLSLTPELNMNGISTITLTVTDQQGLTAQTSFVLTVNAVNDTPLITLSEEKVVNINSLPATISFTVTDEDVLSCNSMVSATSSNTTLLANNGIVISGTAPNCTAQITTVTNNSGVSIIKFTATDSSLLSSNQSIRFKVNDFIAVPQNFSTFNKLPSDTVYDVHVTKNGTQETIYVATAGGLAISKDGGETFVTRNASDGIQGYNLMDVFADSSGVYLAANGGIFVSRDEGKTFSKLTTVNANFYSVTVSGSTIYAGSNSGLYISRNSGQTFTKAPTVSGVVQDIAVKGTSIYAATTVGLFISSDDGVSFSTQTTSNGLGSNNVRGVYVDAENRVYAATWAGGLSILQPGATSFTNIYQLPGETYHNSSPTGAGLFTGVTGDSDGNIYVTSAWGGIAISSDNGVSFWGDSATQGIYRYGLKAFVFEGKIYYSGGGMSISTNGGVSFTTKNTTALPSLTTAIQVYKDSNNNEKIYASTLRGVYVSSNNKGSEFTGITNSNYYTYGLHVVGDKIYFGTSTKGVGIANLDGSNEVYKSTDKGLGNVYVNRVVVNNDKIYACTNGGLSISTDLTGDTFTNKTTADGLGSNTVYAVAFDDNGNIYVATAAGLSISTDNGVSFVNKTATLPSIIVRSVFISGGKIYAGTNSGLGISTDLTASSFSKKTTSQVLKVFVDGSNVYIVSGGTYGVSTNGGTNFTYKSETNGIAGLSIYDFSFNQDGDVFLGLYGGAGLSGKFSGNQVP